MKVALIGGKTGGHLMPLMALAEELFDRDDELVFFCSHHELDRKILDKTSFKFYPFTIFHWKQGLFLSLLSMIRSLWKAQKIARLHKIDLFLSTGSFLSIPLMFTAFLLKKPSVIIELNVIPGRANRLLSRFVHKICLGFPETQSRWPKSVQKKLVYTGVPVRKKFFNSIKMSKKQFCQTGHFQENTPLLLVIGGSQGAAILNTVVPKLVAKLPNTQWIHITGASHYENIRASYQKKDLSRVHLTPFCDIIEDFIMVSDFVISRSGANTIAEIKVLEKRAILIPLKTSSDDHQLWNALHCQQQGWCVCVEESERLCEQIFSHLKTVLPDCP